MRKIFTLTLIALASCALSCSGDYDDSALWKDIDNIWKELSGIEAQVGELNDQVTAFAEIVSGGVITSVTLNGDGNYVIAYNDAGGGAKTVTIATKDDVVDTPNLGMQEQGGVYYWTMTSGGATDFLLDTDGEKIPVGGRAPAIAVDTEGYWTVNGRRIKDDSGADIKAKDGNVSLFTEVELDGDGNMAFTLGDGTVVTVPVFDAFSIAFDVETVATVDDPALPFAVNYTVSGRNASAAVAAISRQNNLTAVLNASAGSITVTFPANFTEGSLVLIAMDAEGHTLVKPLFFKVILGAGGIFSAADLVEFAQAVNSGGSLRRWRNEAGAVTLNANIDMSAVTSWTPIGAASTTAIAGAATTYTTTYPFEGTFDGQGYSITNINWSMNVADGSHAKGLFGALSGATVRNLTLGSASDNSKITLTGTARQGTALGAVAGYASEATIENCKSYVDLAFAGTDADKYGVMIGGIAGVSYGSVVGGAASAEGCANYGDITCGTITNLNNGAWNGMTTGGICGMMYGTDAQTLNCVNNGAVSAPSGRTGGICGTVTAGKIDKCVNNGLIQDDVNGVFAAVSATTRHNYKRMGGLVGGAAATSDVSNSVNNGNVFSYLGCRTGGFIGHNNGRITACENKGVILSDYQTISNAGHGAGWACGYNDNAANITGCVKGGRVGDYTLYGGNPGSAPEASFKNALAYGNFNVSANGLSDESDEYYEWTLAESKTLHAGVKYYSYNFDYVSQRIYVLEVDLTNTNVELATAMANDQILNPNANGNSNNGKNLRETLSEIASRKRSEGANIVGGTNSGFFDSNDGFPRGFHIQDGEPMYINNPTVRAQLTNHAPGFTFFKDRTVSFDKRTFKGVMQVDGTDYEYYSINDSIVRLTAPVKHQHDANLYTWRFKKEPFPGITNGVGVNALFIVGRNETPMLTNEGAVDAEITAIVDGLSATVAAPYVTNENEWVLQVTGSKAAALKAALTVGKKVKMSAEVAVGGATKPIMTLNSSMYHFLRDGVWSKPSISSDPEDPTTLIGANEAGNKVYLIAIDGRTTADKGMNYYQNYRICRKLGCHNAVRFDGGGSTTMWVYDQGAGAIVNNPCDSKGERSCMNYMLVRIKQ